MEKIFLYSGKAKNIYKTTENNLLIQEFTDNITAGNGAKKDILTNKGKLNNAISAKIMQHLQDNKIETHFIKKIDDYNQLIKKVKIIPLEVIIRNRSAGSFCKRYGVSENQIFDEAIIEFCLKDDDLNDPPIAESHISALKIISESEIDYIKKISFEINNLLQKLFSAKSIILVDFKLEFGWSSESDYKKIILADEISPDSMRLWHKDNLEKMDKDRFRLDLGNLIDYYEKIYNIL